LEDDKPELVSFPLKKSHSKAKITPSNNEAPVDTDLEAKVDVPAEVQAQVEAVNEAESENLQCQKKKSRQEIAV
jgi:hypothetical protein